MPLDTAPHTLTIPADLYSQIEAAAVAKGQDPDQFALATLTATAEATVKADGAETEPAWKQRLRASQLCVEQARLAHGISEEEIGADIDAAIKTYRLEQAKQEPRL